MNTIHALNKTLSKTFILGAMGLLVGLSALACGDDTDSSSSNSCCLNGSFYSCPDSDAQNSCNFTDGADECNRDSSRDDECN